MPCSNCGAPTGTCNHTCDDYSHETPCCPKPSAVPIEVCDVKVSVSACEATNRTVWPVADDLNGDCLCPCGPCPGDIPGFTQAQKDWIHAMIKGFRETVIPYDVCGCEVAPSTGHIIPIKPNDADLELDPLTGLYHLKPDVACCTTFKDSPFMSTGVNQNSMVYSGGRPSYHGMDQVFSGSAAGMDRFLKLLCCLDDLVDEVATI